MQGSELACCCVVAGHATFVSRLKRIHVLCEASLGGVVAVEGWGVGHGEFGC